MTVLDTWKCFCSIKIITHNENILFPRDNYFNLYMFLFVILYIVFFLENFISDKNSYKLFLHKKTFKWFKFICSLFILLLL